MQEAVTKPQATAPAAPVCPKCGNGGRTFHERSVYEQPHPCYSGFWTVDVVDEPCDSCDAGAVELLAERERQAAIEARYKAEAACPLITLAVQVAGYIPF